MSLSFCTIWWIYINLDFTCVTPCTEEAVIEDDNDDKTLDDFTSAVFKQKT